MKSLFHLCFFSALLLPLTSSAQTQNPSAGHIKAAGAVLDASGLEQSFSLMVENMIEVQSREIPDSVRSRFMGVMKNFMGKYFTYAQIKPGMAKIYAAEFSEEELNELARFYATPTGKKAAQKLPVLQQKGMDLGIAMVKEHQSELQQMIQDAFGKK